jgi:hypothetical protein
MYRITVCSFARGSLALEVESPRGNIVRSKASVATIRALLAANGHTISAEDLAAIAFCGRQRIFPAPSTETAQSSDRASSLHWPKSS